MTKNTLQKATADFEPWKIFKRKNFCFDTFLVKTAMGHKLFFSSRRITYPSAVLSRNAPEKMFELETECKTILLKAH